MKKSHKIENPAVAAALEFLREHGHPLAEGVVNGGWIGWTENIRRPDGSEAGKGLFVARIADQTTASVRIRIVAAHGNLSPATIGRELVRRRANFKQALCSGDERIAGILGLRARARQIKRTEGEFGAARADLDKTDNGGEHER